MPIITHSVTLQMFCELAYPLSHVYTETHQPPIGCTCNPILHVYVFLRSHEEPANASLPRNKERYVVVDFYKCVERRWMPRTTSYLLSHPAIK